MDVKTLGTTKGKMYSTRKEAENWIGIISFHSSKQEILQNRNAETFFFQAAVSTTMRKEQ
jgi:hypothetical protein